MTADAAWRVLDAPPTAAPAFPPWIGVVILAVLVVTLGVKVALQSAPRPARRNVLRLLDVVIAPLFVAFIIIVVERFRDLG